MPIESMQAHRENTAKTPGKSGRFARRLGLVGGIATGLTFSSVLSAQPLNTSRSADKADAKMEIAAVNSKLPAKTYVMGKDTLKNLASVDARAKANETPAPVVNKLGQTIIGEPFCDVRFEGEKVIFENLAGADKRLQITDILHNEIGGDFNKDATIVFVKQTNSVFVHNGKLLAHYRLIKDPNALGGIKIEPQLVTENNGLPLSKTPIISKDGKLVIFSQDDGCVAYETGKRGKEAGHTFNGRLFTHSGAIYEDVEKGIFVATTPTELFVKNVDKILIADYTLQFGEGPSLEKPIIDKEGQYIRIRDPTMKGNGTQFKIMYDLKTDEIGLYKEDMSFSQK